MKKELFTFTGTAGNSLPAVIWLPEKTPKLLFQITHGMTEHMGRYEKLAEKLTEQGIVTAGFDLPGHGRNPGHPDCASFGEAGWTQTLADMQAFSEQLTSRFAGVPLVLMGFSLGSFLVRDYLSSGYPLPSAAVIMGTGTQPSLLLSGIKKLVEREIKKEGFNNTTPLFTNYLLKPIIRNSNRPGRISTGSALMSRNWKLTCPIHSDGPIFLLDCFGSCWMPCSVLHSQNLCIPSERVSSVTAFRSS